MIQFKRTLLALALTSLLGAWSPPVSVLGSPLVSCSLAIQIAAIQIAAIQTFVPSR